MDTILKFKGESVAVKIADTPRLLNKISTLTEVFSEGSVSYLLKNQTTKVNVYLFNLYSGAALFCTLIPNELTKIYFTGKDVSDLPTLLNEIMASENVFVVGSKEKSICDDLVLNYQNYKEEEYKYIGYDTNDFPIFRKIESVQSILL